MRRILAVANLALRFLVELLALGFFGYGVFGTVSGPWRFVLGALAVVAVAVVWAFLFAPTAKSGLSKAQKDLFGTVVLLLAAGVLALAGQVAGAATYAVIVLANVALLFLLRTEVTNLVGDAAK